MQGDHENDTGVVPPGVSLTYPHDFTNLIRAITSNWTGLGKLDQKYKTGHEKTGALWAGFKKIDESFFFFPSL